MALPIERFIEINGAILEVESGNRATVCVEANQPEARNDGSAAGRVAFSLTWDRTSTPEDDRQADIMLDVLLTKVCGVSIVKTISNDKGEGAERRARHYVRTGSLADPHSN